MEIKTWDEGETLIEGDPEKLLLIKETGFAGYLGLSMVDPMGFAGVLLSKDDWDRIKGTIDVAFDELLNG